MTYRCVDAETTALPDNPEGEPTGMMELGWCDMRNHIIKPPVAVLVDSGIPVGIGARAIHHISDEMVAGELKPSEACKLLTEGNHEYLCAHNIEHEKVYVGAGVIPGTEEERKWLCTYKTALRLWPDAPSHKLMELRYFLKLDDAEDFDPKLADPPHRAPADAYVCAHLLRKILIEAGEQKIDMERLVKWSAGPALLYMCWLKKHKGTPWKDVPHDYLDWILNKSDINDRDIRATAKFYYTRKAKPDASGNPYP